MLIYQLCHVICCYGHYIDRAGCVKVVCDERLQFFCYVSRGVSFIGHLGTFIYYVRSGRGNSSWSWWSHCWGEEGWRVNVIIACKNHCYSGDKTTKSCDIMKLHGQIRRRRKKFYNPLLKSGGSCNNFRSEVTHVIKWGWSCPKLKPFFLT